MNISSGLEILIKNNYKGSMLSLEDDVSKIFSIKRTLKKNILHDSLKDNAKNVKLLVNNVQFLYNIFDEPVLDTIFNELLDELELWHYRTVLYFIGKGNGEYDGGFYRLLNGEIC